MENDANENAPALKDAGESEPDYGDDDEVLPDAGDERPPLPSNPPIPGGRSSVAEASDTNGVLPNSSVGDSQRSSTATPGGSGPSHQSGGPPPAHRDPIRDAPAAPSADWLGNVRV